MLDEDVGGGGGPSGEDSAGWYGGGGSGNVVHQAIQMLGRSSKQFWIKVGSSYSLHSLCSFTSFTSASSGRLSSIFSLSPTIPPLTTTQLRQITLFKGNQSYIYIKVRSSKGDSKLVKSPIKSATIKL